MRVRLVRVRLGLRLRYVICNHGILIRKLLAIRMLHNDGGACYTLGCTRLHGRVCARV